MENIPEKAKESPALIDRADDYPARFHDRVPLKIRMLRTVHSDIPALALRAFGQRPCKALRDQVYYAWTNSFGAVAAVFDDGEMLGVKPDEFEVVEWWPLVPSGLIVAPAGRPPSFVGRRSMLHVAREDRTLCGRSCLGWNLPYRGREEDVIANPIEFCAICLNRWTSDLLEAGDG